MMSAQTFAHSTSMQQQQQIQPEQQIQPQQQMKPEQAQQMHHQIPQMHPHRNRHEKVEVI